jgi:hypothetical protein
MARLDPLGQGSVFTRQMEQSGVRLIPGGSTPPIGEILHTGKSIQEPDRFPFAGLQSSHKRSGGVDVGVTPVGHPLGFTSADIDEGVPVDPTSFDLQSNPFINLAQSVDFGSGAMPADFVGPFPLAEGSFAGASPVTSPEEGVSSLIQELGKFPTAQESKSSDFGPDVSLLPAEQQQLFAEELETKGGIFQSLGKIAGSPGFAKALASLGAVARGPHSQFGAGGLSPLGELAFAQADANAERLFEEKLDRGLEASTIHIAGLTAESRQKILARREGETNRASLLELSATREERLGDQEARLATRAGQVTDLHALQMTKLQQEVAEGTIDLAEAQQQQAFALELAKSGLTEGEALLNFGADLLGIDLPDANKVTLKAIPLNKAHELLMAANRLKIAKINQTDDDDKPTQGLPQRIASTMQQRVKLLQKQEAKGLNSGEINTLLKLDELMVKFAAEAGVVIDLNLPATIEEQVVKQTPPGFFERLFGSSTPQKSSSGDTAAGRAARLKGKK